jgi:iron only hydrogenase large subunit-like protein
VTALRKLGFDYVYDTLSGADLTTMEEGHEMIARQALLNSRKEHAA